MLLLPFVPHGDPGIFPCSTVLIALLGVPTEMKPFTTPSPRDLALAQWSPAA